MISLLALFLLINSDRTTPIYYDPLLAEKAQIRAEQFCHKEALVHDGILDSFTLWPGHFVGENLARNFKDATSTHEALIASPTHKAVLTDTRYWYMGMGNACGVTVELFRN